MCVPVDRKVNMITVHQQISLNEGTCIKQDARTLLWTLSSKRRSTASGKICKGEILVANDQVCKKTTTKKTFLEQDCKSSSIEKFIISATFFIFIMPSYLSPVQSYNTFCYKIHAFNKRLSHLPWVHFHSIRYHKTAKCLL